MGAHKSGTKLEREGLADIELVKARPGYLERKEQRVPVGTFGIITANGEEHTITWVENNFRKRKPAEKPAPLSHWAKYQLQSMFANWNKEEATCQDTQVV